MNHIMVSFSDHYNSIFIDRVPYRHKNWQFHGILIISFQIILLSPHRQKVTFSAKNVKNNHSLTRDSLKYTKSCTKTNMLRPFLKTAPYMRILKSLGLNSEQELYRKI